MWLEWFCGGECEELEMGWFVVVVESLGLGRVVAHFHLLISLLVSVWGLKYKSTLLGNKVLKFKFYFCQFRFAIESKPNPRTLALTQRNV